MPNSVNDDEILRKLNEINCAKNIGVESIGVPAGMNRVAAASPNAPRSRRVQFSLALLIVCMCEQTIPFIVVYCVCIGCSRPRRCSILAKLNCLWFTLAVLPVREVAC